MNPDNPHSREAVVEILPQVELLPATPVNPADKTRPRLGKALSDLASCRLDAGVKGLWACVKPGVRPAFGVFFLILGVLGLFLPILQGVLFLFIACSLLAPYSPFIQRQRARLEARYPKLIAAEQKCHEAWERWLDRAKSFFTRGA